MKVDIALVHPPSIYDFRKRYIREGPVSDVIPSTPLFEMYPVGFVSMLNHAMDNGLNGRISNLAVLMLSDKRFDVERYLRDLDAEVYGIDLHWLPHVHGAFEIAKIIKRLHPDRKVLMGGFSASYFATDVLENNESVDFVLRGDFIEKQLVELLNTVERGSDISKVPNLVYRDGKKIRTNPPLKDPDPGSSAFINYAILLRTAVRHRDIKGHLPFLSWIKNPIGMTLIQRGCQFNCGFCGGSDFAYKSNYFERSPVRRDPSRVAEELEVIMDTIHSPVFIAGDLNHAGEKYYMELFHEIRDRGIDLPLLTEFFVPPGEDYFKTLSKYVPEYSCEISPDSSDERIRRITGRPYTNEELEKCIEFAAKHGSRKFDVYFTIGLPYQTAEDVLADSGYIHDLIETHNKSGMPVHAFISPLAPFIDPGSLFYEKPEQYGYTVKTKGIMDFYNLLENGRSWEDYLNYETKWMSKEDMVWATYQSGLRMIEVGSKLGYISDIEKENIQQNILSYMNGSEYLPVEDKSGHLTYLVKEIDWSYRHGITAVSLMVFAYSLYERIRRHFTS